MLGSVENYYPEQYLNGDYTLGEGKQPTLEEISQVSSDLKSKKHFTEAKFLKQLKAKDMKAKFSHSKLPFQQMPTLSFKKQPESTDKKSQKHSYKDSFIIYPKQKHSTNEQIKKALLSKNYSINPELQLFKEKDKITVQRISNFQLQVLKQSQETQPLAHKNGKKFQNNRINHSLYRDVRISRSQSKKQKNYRPSYQNESKVKGISQYYTQMHAEPSIFQSLSINRQVSHHSLDKNNKRGENINIFEDKLEGKFQLPTLGKNKPNVPNPLLPFEGNMRNSSIHYEHQLGDNNEAISREKQNSSHKGVQQHSNNKGVQKLIKIPIQKLRPLKPEQIKLKYERKIKQEQKNRAKDIAMQIFSKGQQAETHFSDDQF